MANYRFIRLWLVDGCINRLALKLNRERTMVKMIINMSLVYTMETDTVLYN